jgi:hypothetical protein
MTRVAVSLLALLLTACATEVFGPYKESISRTDIEEIKALIATRSDIPNIHKGYLRISATRRDCIYVQTAATLFDEIGTSFIACRSEGKWHIKEGSIQEPKVIVTSIPIPVTSYPHGNQ